MGTQHNNTYNATHTNTIAIAIINVQYKHTNAKQQIIYRNNRIDYTLS